MVRKKHLPTFDEIKRQLQIRLGNVSVPAISYHDTGFSVDINMDLSKSGQAGKEQLVADNVLIFLKKQWPNIYWGVKINGVGFAKTSPPSHHEYSYHGDDPRSYSR